MSLLFTLRLRNGEKKILSEPVGHTDGEVELAVLHKAIAKIQGKTNDLLTVCVEEQKSAGLQNNHDGVEGNEDDIDEDDIDEDDIDEDEETDNEPEKKKQKK